MPVIIIESKKQFDDIINGDKPVVVDFWADWCGPCKAIAPLYEKLSNEGLDVLLCKVNIDQNSDVAQEVGIKVVPTFMYFKNGNKVEELKGAIPENVKALVSKAATGQ